LTFVVLGAFSYSQLGIDLFPKSIFPRSRCPLAFPAQAGRNRIADHQAHREVLTRSAALTNLRSTTLEGTSVVVVQFTLDKDANVAAQEFATKSATSLGSFPRDTDPPIIERLDFDASPVSLHFRLWRAAVARKSRRLRQADQAATGSVKDIGSIQIVGGSKREIEIWLDARSCRLTPHHRQIRNAISNAEYRNSRRTHRPGTE